MAIEIVGTGHILEKSVAEVRERISNEKPDFVAVELDIKRFKALEESGFRPESYKPPSLGDIVSSFRRGGSFPVFLQMVLAMIQREVAKRYGAQPGVDMCTAILTARDLGCRLVLMDRDIEVTMNRLMGVPVKEWLSLLASNKEEDFQAISSIFQGDIADILEQKNLDKVLTLFRKRNPHIYEVLIDERDRYMALSLNALQENQPEAKIIAVMGAGHKRGTSQYLEKLACDQEIEVEQLMKTKKASILQYGMLALLVSGAFILMKSEFLFRKKGRWNWQ